ncbi:MAG: L,D-transpeptidase [Anaerolineae bacterium]|nr:L,D-transpeptidase [Anaerolineae bacterium]
MFRPIGYLIAASFLLNACSNIPWLAAPVFALANENSPKEQRFKSGIAIPKPTYTPLPTATATITPEPTFTATAVQSPTLVSFAELDFVVIEDLAPPNGLDASTQYDNSPTYSGTKYILIDISEQHMYVYEGDTLVYSFIASTGINNATRPGTFSVLNKIPNAFGATWNIWMPNWLGIYWAGSLQNGIHALPILSGGGTLWAGYLGTPISYGCIVLGTYDAQTLYQWAEVGTPVEIRW